MLSQSEAKNVCIVSRCFMYKLFQRVFGEEPSLELLYMIINEYTENVLFVMLGEEYISVAVDILSTIRDALSASEDIAVESTKDEYTRLLIGPGKLLAPPWESVYMDMDMDETIFHESMLSVRQVYRKYGLCSVGYPNSADDHIAIELDFMAILSGLLVDCYEQNRMDNVEWILLDQKDFLEKHLLSWIHSYSSRLQTDKVYSFYPRLVNLMCMVLEADSVLLEELRIMEQQT